MFMSQRLSCEQKFAIFFYRFSIMNGGLSLHILSCCDVCVGWWVGGVKMTVDVGVQCRIHSSRICIVGMTDPLIM